MPGAVEDRRVSGDCRVVEGGWIRSGCVAGRRKEEPRKQERKVDRGRAEVSTPSEGKAQDQVALELARMSGSPGWQVVGKEQW